MKFLRYKPVKWGVKVGQSYSPNYEGIRFFYDIDSRDGELSNSADNISDLAYILRRELIKPDQIENIGTINPIKTSEIKDRLFENLIKRVSRPMIIVYDLPLERVHKTKINEYGLDSNKKFAIELGDMMQITKLDNVAGILNSYGASSKDVRFFRTDEFGYYPISKYYQYHILASLEK